MSGVYKIDPLWDCRWQALVDHHPNGSVFHTTAWLEALRKTYGYKPVAFTTSPPTGALTNGLLFCRVQSWLTKPRMVSLPFSDHCEPLCDSEEMDFLTRYLQCELDHHNWKYLELRPLNERFSEAETTSGFRAVDTYAIHRIDLRLNLHDLFQTLDKNSIRRRVQRAEHAGLVERCGRSEDLLRDFYRLSVLTRRRHRLPPQPYTWFQNLIGCFGDGLEIRSAYKDGAAVASILTLRFRDTTYYKYGSSDAAFHYLGSMPYLLWKAIAEAKTGGATVFDLGRTHPNDTGLMAFKNKWVHEAKPLVYWKFPTSPADATKLEWRVNFAKRLFSYMPDRFLTMAGRLIYPHIG